MPTQPELYGGAHSTPDLRLRFQGVAPQYLFFFFHYGGGAPPLVSRQVGFFANIAFMTAHKMSNSFIYSKRPPPISKKSGYTYIGSKFRGVAPPVFCIYSYWGGSPPPGKSSSEP